MLKSIPSIKIALVKSGILSELFYILQNQLKLLLQCDQDVKLCNRKTTFKQLIGLHQYPVQFLPTLHIQLNQKNFLTNSVFQVYHCTVCDERYTRSTESSPNPPNLDYSESTGRPHKPEYFPWKTDSVRRNDVLDSDISESSVDPNLQIKPSSTLFQMFKVR